MRGFTLPIRVRFRCRRLSTGLSQPPTGACPRWKLLGRFLKERVAQSDRGAWWQIRTADLHITSVPLYQLSQPSMLGCFILVIIPQSGQPTPSFQYHSAATPTDSVLYPLRRFPVSFATDTGTFGYSQAQHLFADSFIGCPLAFDSGPRVDHAHQFNVVVYGDSDAGQYIGIEPTLSA